MIFMYMIVPQSVCKDNSFFEEKNFSED